MIRYIHGSQDSIDLDIIYVFDKLPTYKECRDFCSENKDENRNIVVINDGIVVDCFIGTCDEINNGIIDTYHLHIQEHKLLIERRLERDVLLKYIRATRGILSILSRTKYRKEIKLALRGGLFARVECLKNIDFTSIDFNDLDKRKNKEDLLKVVAFQLGQTIGLLNSLELYSKKDIADTYINLKPFLYRENILDYSILNNYRDMMLEQGERYSVVDFIDGTSVISETNKATRKFDMIHEKEESRF